MMIWNYLDGDMSSAERNRFEKQLQEDIMLKKEYEQITILHQGLTKHQLKSAPEHLFDQVIKRVQSESSPGFSLVPLLKRLIPAIVVVTLLVWLFPYHLVGVEGGVQITNYSFQFFEILTPYFSFMAYLFVPLLFLLGLDRILKKRFMSPN